MGAEYCNAPMQVKIVRESMNRMIEAWKEIPDAEEEECSSASPPASQSQRRSSLTGEGPFHLVVFVATNYACTDLLSLFLYPARGKESHKFLCFASSDELHAFFPFLFKK